MNTDFRLSIGYFTHTKVQKLGRRLGDSGVLAHIKLLSYAAQNRPTGALTNMDADDIAIACGYAGDIDAFLRTLQDLRLLDTGDAGVLELHDWAEHNPWASGAADRTDAGRKAAQARWEQERERKAREQAAREGRAYTPDPAPAAPAPTAPPTPKPAAPGRTAPAPASAPSQDAPSCPAQETECAPHAEPCAPHQSALPDASIRNAPFLSSPLLPDSSPPDSLPTPSQPTPNPPARGAPEPSAPPDAGCVAVLGMLAPFVPDPEKAAALLARHDCEAVRWQIRAVRWRQERQEADPKPGGEIQDPAAYLLTALEKTFPLPAEVKLERDVAEGRRKAEEVREMVAAEAARKEAAKRDRAALDAAFARVQQDPVALEAFEAEVLERAKAVPFNRDKLRATGKLHETVLRPLRDALLSEKGLLEKGVAAALAERAVSEPPEGSP